MFFIFGGLFLFLVSGHLLDFLKETFYAFWGWLVIEILIRDSYRRLCGRILNYSKISFFRKLNACRFLLLNTQINEYSFWKEGFVVAHIPKGTSHHETPNYGHEPGQNAQTRITVENKGPSFYLIDFNRYTLLEANELFNVLGFKSLAGGDGGTPPPPPTVKISDTLDIRKKITLKIQSEGDSKPKESLNYTTRLVDELMKENQNKSYSTVQEGDSLYDFIYYMRKRLV